MQVAVVGASYSGLSAAKALVDAKIDTTVFDCKKDIERFNCGEAFVSNYGVGAPPEDCTYYPVKEVVCYFGGRAVSIPIRKGCTWMTDRAKLQRKMYEDVRDSVDFRFSSRTNITKLKGRYDYIIDASGFPAQSTKEGYFDPIQKSVFAIFQRVTGDFSKWFDHRLRMWWTNKGYFWCFPQTEKQANVGMGEIGHNCKYEDLKMSAKKQLGITIGDEYEVMMSGGGSLPLDHLNRFTHGNILVVGEAAGLTNYVTEEGAQFAIASGREAGRSIAGGDIRRYETYVKDVLMPEVERSKRWNRLLYSRCLANMPMCMFRYVAIWHSRRVRRRLNEG